MEGDLNVDDRGEVYCKPDEDFVLRTGLQPLNEVIHVPHNGNVKVPLVNLGGSSEDVMPETLLGYAEARGCLLNMIKAEHDSEQSGSIDKDLETPIVMEHLGCSPGD